jgi:hypothetical protein
MLGLGISALETIDNPAPIAKATPKDATAPSPKIAKAPPAAMVAPPAIASPATAEIAILFP